MARVQTRRNISISRALHERLQAWCKANDKACSRVVEDLLAELPGRNQDMRNEFQVHMLNDDGVKLAEALAEVFSSTLDTLDRLIPPSTDPRSEVNRCRALVVTKLQEASFFAKRAIAVDPKNQKSG